MLHWYVDRWKERYTCALVCGQMEGTVHLCIGMWSDGRNGTPVYWYVDRWKERYTCSLVCGQMEGTVHLCIGMWTDGRYGAPVFWLDFVTIGMRLLSACAVKGTSRVP